MPEVSPQQWDQYVADLQAALAASSGLQRMQIEAQIEDAKQGRENAMKIANLQAETSRYGVDAQRATAMAQLAQNAKQFEQTHALELKKFGLSYASAASDFMSSPDRFAQGRDFIDMAQRYAMGAGGPQPYGQGNEFRGNTEEDFAVMANGGAPRASTGPASGGYAPRQAVVTPHGGTAATRASYAAPAGAPGAGGAEGPDPRVKVITEMYKQLPPSRGEGLAASDFAVMNAATEIMRLPQRPGTLENMRPDQRAIYSSYVKKSGRSWNDYLEDYNRTKPGQGNVRSAG